MILHIHIYIYIYVYTWFSGDCSTWLEGMNGASPQLWSFQYSSKGKIMINKLIYLDPYDWRDEHPAIPLQRYSWGDPSPGAVNFFPLLSVLDWFQCPAKLVGNHVASWISKWKGRGFSFPPFFCLQFGVDLNAWQDVLIVWLYVCICVCFTIPPSICWVSSCLPRFFQHVLYPKSTHGFVWENCAFF